ncbi:MULTISPECIES: N-acetylmuramidase domain-containing protein [unclassified Agarivorans]|uniref:N-acetylmuramidase domain-containing protein n=1 Tax=unclassified Agarivorans TaxID=2636026 RepID=UPI0026E20027|nr:MULTISPECIES: N-acetylmuramidase domain-containing protein [unclassified Agarivorans]MDO6685487.1 N-acetylmuramidase domain-containing protein [Agarivorans sp. 3_MG-2023]MDO6715873.1 N-acetylmuramidase domain-containing protein [Agarivorans sp. 2_MG-2023]
MAKLQITQSVGMGGTNKPNDVKAVQAALNQILGQIPPTKKLVVDGKLGSKPENSKTVAAIKVFQKKVVGMVRPDGKIDANGRSHRKLNEKLDLTALKKYSLPVIGNSEKLLESDFEAVAKALKCEVAAVKAVAEVESSGDAFFSNGKPKILFEAHIFSKLTKRIFDTSHPEISSRTWNRSLYAGGIAEYKRLEKAIKLNSNAAIQAASWGRFQIMGFNYKLAGFSTAESFVSAMFSSERKQLDAFASFVEKSNLTKHIQTKDWAAFAKGYNGSQYHVNKYDVKLEKAYKKYV